MVRFDGIGGEGKNGNMSLNVVFSVFYAFVGDMKRSFWSGLEERSLGRKMKDWYVVDYG